ncbi:MAG: AAA family ATPase [Campylobacterota bacterium]|nr:AAA family ATPase [Campylobacterota bacterium]
MELVYLWVDSYKNIENQGFNFSPRFECSYNEDTKELTIDEKKEHIGIFPDNINVTAIVGENGSGKSNILKALFQSDDYSSTDDKLWYILYSKDEAKLKIYFIDHMGIYEKRDIEKNNIHTIDTLKDSANIMTEVDFSMIYFSNTLQYLPIHNDNQDKSFYNISTSYLIDRYNRKISNNEFIDFKYQYNYYKSKLIEQRIIMLNDSSLKLDFELPQELNIVTQGTYPSDRYEIMKKLLQEEDNNDFRSKVKKNVIYNYLFDYLDEDELKTRIDTDEKKTILEFYEEIKSKIPLQSELDDFLKLLKNPGFLMVSVKIQNIDDSFIKKLEKFNSANALSLGILDVFHFNWKPELSSGQENYLFQFASFYDTLKNATNLKDDIVILIDEGETTMHPNWQKGYIKYYIDFLEKNFKNKKFHIVLTSHSPFILSDIPKENVIFLKDGEQDKTVNINTFGANIHTLLSHGFFMKYGLMGEFAKSKITEILEFLNDTTKLKTIKKEQVKPIIESIGEDFLRNKLLNLYNKRFIDERKKEILAERIEELQKQYDELGT